ncbi:MAG: TIGR01906 family membrane protein [Lachnospiraceae bacterium]|nr:TIGR01906 family membrane protein [Lachnospiraceae bacterium]
MENLTKTNNILVENKEKEKVIITGKILKRTTIVMAIVTALFIISMSITIPILWRGFYYNQIDMLGVVSDSGYSREQIIKAYDEMMDFCTGKTDKFATGILPYSESGKEHFADVKKLFIFDMFVAVCTSITLIVVCGQIFVFKKKIVSRIKGKSFLFWGSCTVFGVFAFLTVAVGLFFDKAFLIFHKLFFPGKTNWTFDWDEDQIIRILPEDYFRNCAILIIVFSMILCMTFVTIDNISNTEKRVSRKQKKNKKVTA